MTAAQRINGWTRRVPAWPLYIMGGLIPVWLFWLGMTGGLGVEPIKELEHRLGLWALKVLIAVLAISPLRKYTRVSLIRYRRALGLVAFWLVAVHLAVWMVLDVQVWSHIWADIVKRPYITIGMLGFALLIPLAATSNDLSVRRMGAAAWKRLHWLTYPAILAGAIHYVMLVKGWQQAPLAYLAVILLLLGMRIRLPKGATRVPAPGQAR